MLLCIFCQWKFLQLAKRLYEVSSFKSSRPEVILGKGVFIKICCIYSEQLFLRTPLDGCFCNLNWIVLELFHFSNHSKLIAFHILILRGRCWFRWSESLFIFFSSSFLHRRWGLRSEDQPTKFQLSNCFITYFLSSSHSYVFYKTIILQNVAIFTEKHLW